MIKVLHLNYDSAPHNLMFPATSKGNVQAVSELYQMDLYQLVAEVRTESLDEALALTRGDWVNNTKVGPYEDETGRGYRSTSVGDILVLADKPYVVSPMGFDEAPVLLKGEDMNFAGR